MPVVNIKGVGPAQFPDGMSVDNIREFLRKKYSQGDQSSLLQPVDDIAAPYNPSLVERAGHGIASALKSTGLISDNYGAQQIGKNLTSIGEFLPVIGDITGLDDAARAYNKGNYGEAALNTAGLIPVLGDMAIFAGVLAKNADLGALHKAKLLEDTGADRNKIWKDTGWVNDKGDWKFEIDDSDRFYTPTQPAHPKDIEVAENRLQELIKGRKEYTAKNSKLFLNKDTPDYVKADITNKLKAFSNDTINARMSLDRVKSEGSPRLLVGDAMSTNVTDYEYPELMDDRFNLKDMPIEFGGAYGTDRSIMINRGRTLGQQESTMMHELQHAVQEKEGFARGGSVSSAPRTINPAYSRWVKARESVDRADEIRGSKEYTNQLTARNDLWNKKYDDAYENANDQDAVKIMKDFKKEAEDVAPLVVEVDRLAVDAGSLDAPSEYIDPHEAYRRLGGEAEARNVQTRLDWTPEQRRSTPPWESLDVPESELIYRK